MNEHRPRLISDANVKAEAEIATDVANLFGFHIERLSEWAYRLDYCASGGWRQDVKGFLEIKDRPRLVIGEYSGVQIAWHKVAHARILTQGTELFAWFVIRVGTGAIIKADLALKASKVILGGRRDRGTFGDIEPMAVLPWDAWTTLDGKNVR